MKRISSIFLKTAIICISFAVLAICTLLLPTLWGDVSVEFPSYSYAIYGIFTSMIVSSIPFFIGMYNAWQLLSLIDKGSAFTKKSATALKIISLAAASITVIYLTTLPLFYIWGDRDDAPGLVVIGMFLVGAPMVVSVFALLLHRLISEAAEIKSENELTV